MLSLFVKASGVPIGASMIAPCSWCTRLSTTISVALTGRNMWNAHCLDHFIADVHGLPVTEGYETNCT